MDTIEIIYWDNATTKTVSKQGTINGYPIGYDRDAELAWVLVSKNKRDPIVLATFRSQEDMEFLLNTKLKRFK